MPASASPSHAPWAPLQLPLFRALWLAALVSNLGTMMHNVAAAWLMTSLADGSPTLVAAVQTANSLPMFLLALPAGALADVVDRRWLILCTQLWMLVVAALLGLFTLQGWASPWSVLTLVFALAVGAALTAPAWQVLVGELVPLRELSAAVALNSAGFNLARSVGPAMGGALVALVGPGYVFLVNAASFLGVIGAVAAWRSSGRADPTASRHMSSAILVGLRHVEAAPEIRAVLVRVGAWIVSASAVWALLPLIARYRLHLGPTGYGTLLGLIGAGAVTGALVMPWLRRRVSLDTALGLWTLASAVGALTPAFTRHVFLVGAAMFLSGLAWLSLLSTYNASVQGAAPVRLRGRVLAVHYLVVFGGLAGGSALWGLVTDLWGLQVALAAAGGGILLALVATARLHVTEPGSLVAAGPTQPSEVAHFIAPVRGGREEP